MLEGERKGGKDLLFEVRNSHCSRGKVLDKGREMEEVSILFNMLQRCNFKKICIFRIKKGKKQSDKKQNKKNFEGNNSSKFGIFPDLSFSNSRKHRHFKSKFYGIVRNAQKGFSGLEEIISRIIIFAIKLYQHSLSPILPKTCRFYPTCSNYAIEALNKKGLVKGVALSLWRILRCNPFSKGGYDPVR